MTTNSRLLKIMDLFTLKQPVISARQLMKALDASRASIYRDLAQLSSAGWIEKVADRGYALGPRIIEMDRQIRLADNLLEASVGLLDRLSEETSGVILLCRVHGDKIICIYQAGRTIPKLSISYERGRAMPLYRGATSKIVLAHLPAVHIARLWATDRDSLVRAGWPDSYGALEAALAAIRAKGHCMAEGEVDPDAVGYAVPLKDGEHLLGSLSTVLPARSATEMDKSVALARLKSTAIRIEGRLQDQRERMRSAS
ncbi:MAG: IclR family transcriptional regulator C-terminal domain-containing protein [Polaromonas sp.]|nr:IclR family transcriptional regulator C-terminal domain-containing protein [Polaromonas sp.]